MNKLVLTLCCLAVFQLTCSLVSARGTDPTAEPPMGGDDDDDDGSRSFWDGAFNLIKKSLGVKPLTCQGANCNTCLSVFGKGGCISVAYNRQAGANAAIQFNVKSNSGRNVWNGSINAGRPVPSCVNLPKPVKEVCIQDVWVSVGQHGPNGDVCFTINFKSYKLGVKFCAGFNAASGFVPQVHPQIIKT